MELCKQRCTMDVFAIDCENMFNSTILKPFQSLKIFLGNINQQWIAIVEARQDESTNEVMASVLINILPYFSNACNVPELNLTCRLNDLFGQLEMALRISSWVTGVNPLNLQASGCSLAQGDFSSSLDSVDLLRSVRIFTILFFSECHQDLFVQKMTTLESCCCPKSFPPPRPTPGPLTSSGR